MTTICAMCSRVSGWNTMTSSSRFKNSGLKVLLISSLTFSAIFSNVARVSGWEKPSAFPLTMSRAPTLEVMMTTVFLKSITRP